MDYVTRIAVAILMLTLAPFQVWGRTWISESGGFRVEAELSEYAKGRVVLRKASGSTVTVEADKLCEADRQYAENWLRNHPSPMQGRLAWEIDLQGIAEGPPIVTRGLCLVAVTRGTTAGNPRDFRVVAIARDTGKVVWQYPLTNARPGPLHVAGGRVVFGTSLVDEFASPTPEPPTLVSLSLADGAVSWKKQFAAKRDANTGRDYTDVTHVAVGAGRLATLAEGLVVLDFDGKELWRDDERRYSQVGGDAELLVVAKESGVSDEDKAGIAAYRWDSREVTWRKELRTGLISPSRPVVVDDQILVGMTSSANTLLARLVGGMPYLYNLQRNNGEERWKAALRWNEYGGGIMGEPTAVGERVFLSDVVGGLVLDKATGKSLKGAWSAEGMGITFEPLDSATVFDGERARDALSGQVRWPLPVVEGRKPLEFPSQRSQSAWISNQLFVVDVNGWLRCVE